MRNQCFKSKSYVKGYYLNSTYKLKNIISNCLFASIVVFSLCHHLDKSDCQKQIIIRRSLYKKLEMNRKHAAVLKWFTEALFSNSLLKE